MKFATLALVSIVAAQPIYQAEHDADHEAQGAVAANGSADWKFSPDSTVPAGTASIDVRIADIIAQNQRNA